MPYKMAETRKVPLVYVSGQQFSNIIINDLVKNVKINAKMFTNYSYPYYVVNGENRTAEE